MIAQFDNNLDASLFLWAENRILNLGQAYINKTSRLYNVKDETLGSSHVAYAAPYKQWVYDSGVAGATIINSVSGSFGTYNKGDNGLKIDYANGRVILNSSVGKKLNISGSYAIKELNFYSHIDDPEEIISKYTKGEFKLNPKYNNSGITGTAPNEIITPAVFLTKLNGNNTPFELGGPQNCQRNYSLMILADDNYQLGAFFSIMEDAKDKSFPLLSVLDDPINEWGDLKSGYNYNNLVASKGGAGNLVFIDSVKTSRISDNFKGPSSTFLGLCDIEVSYVRTTS